MTAKKAKDDAVTMRIVTGVGSTRVDPETGEILSEDEQTRSLRDLIDQDDLPGGGFITGDQDQMTMIVTSPDTVISSRLKIKAADLGIKGQFKSGSKVRLTIEVEVGDVNFKRRKDSMGYVTGVERIHTAELVDWGEE